MFKHTEQTDARIRRGYEAGERILDIANELGVTRNTIIGRARRIGLAQTGRQYASPYYAVHTPEGNAIISAVQRKSWDENRENRVAAIRAGHARYHANRKANHSATRDAVPAE